MIKIKYISIIVLLSAFMIDATIANNTTQDNNTNINLHNNIINNTYAHCECIQYNCGCCHYLTWNSISLEGLLCTNASYLDKDLGFSVTVSYNDLIIINETISARNPPPICFGEYIIPNLKAEICLRLYDINISKTDIHGCFELEARLIRIKILPIQLGCFDTKMNTVKIINETENMIHKGPVVIMV
ncbi:PREDICTED: uncharacterized protein LOC107071920 [Polistes dominula]|uniref:Uncharacterized protein LOC107071920 n=1 Tax=Polistes dominula TaxID=743375 RepID=A0ABM1J315_POLDO|nr:PREDICTED: uncharacterized protein LOC107071920 [Polistes dominula]